ncbi:MAG: hypothetical protein ACTHJ3_10255 [Pararhizobium sp.]
MENLMAARSDSTSARHAALGLGWFSLALGAAELLAPRAIQRQTGAGPSALLRAFGLREIGAGVAILCSERPVRMVWARVAGDLIDLAALLPTASSRNPSRGGGLAALAFVGVATAIDVCVALQGDD